MPFVLAASRSAALDRTTADTLLLTIYGQSNATDVGGGQNRTGLGDRELPPSTFMFEGGPATFRLAPGPLVPYDPGPRDRSASAILMCLAPWRLAPEGRTIVDLPGRSGAGFKQIGPGTPPFQRLVDNHLAAANDCRRDGTRLLLSPLFVKGGEQDMRLFRDRRSVADLIRALDVGLRDALSLIPGAETRPMLLWQPSCHMRVRDRRRDRPDPAETAFGIADAGRTLPHVAVTHPGYTERTFDGVHLEAGGHVHCGLMFAKVWKHWLENGHWRPLEPVAAHRLDDRSLSVRFHVPVPPLRIEAETIRPLADGCHGIELWTDGGQRRLALASAVIDGPDRVRVRATEPLPDGELLIRTAYETDAPAPSAGLKHDYRNGPDFGPRTNLCDSDPTTAELHDGSGHPYDLRNFCLIAEVAVT